MQSEAELNYELLRTSYNATACWTVHGNPDLPPQRVLLHDGPLEFARLLERPQPDGANIVMLQGPTFRPQICILHAGSQSTHHTRCWNEPVPGGVQVQPRGYQHVGTLAGLVRTGLGQNEHRYCALTNWHVAPRRVTDPALPLHQPHQMASPIAGITNANQPKPGVPNLVDASLGSCWIDGHHTLDTGHVGLPHPSPLPTNLTKDQTVTKSGRTTGVTTGRVLATAAATRVNFGDFVAEFVDQDVIIQESKPFSAPGDSGSMIFHEPTLAPAGLLFAGGGQYTIANPIRHVTDALDLQWPILDD